MDTQSPNGQTHQPLYDAGYNELVSLPLLIETAKALNATIMDVRYSPWSRDPQWLSSSLRHLYPEGYTHVNVLGNKNYKSGPIEIVNPVSGLKIIEYVLRDRPVILLCACRNRQGCHRLVIANMFEQEYGIASIPLTRELCFEITGGSADQNPGSTSDPQMKLW